jgi:hypothetical protein
MIAAVILVIFIGLRREVGADWWSYRQILQYTNFTGAAYTFARTEPAFALANSIAAKAGFGVWFPDLVCAVIFVWGLVSFCKRQPNPWLGLVVSFPYLVIGVAMGLTRQSAAVGVVMLALAAYMDGKTYRAFAILAIAPLFHVSALVVIPMMLVAEFGFNIAAAIPVIMFAAVLTLQLEDRILSRLSYYVTETVISSGAAPRVAMNVIAAVLFLFFRKRLGHTPRDRQLWLVWSLSAFACIPLLVFIRSSTVVDRFAIYLVPLQIFVLASLPTALQSGRKQNFPVVFLVVCYSFAAEFVWLTNGRMAREFLPYNNYIWDQSPAPMIPERARVFT